MAILDIYLLVADFPWQFPRSIHCNTSMTWLNCVMQPELPWLLAADGDEFVRRRLTHPHTHQPLRFSARRYFDRTSRIAIVRMRYTAAPSDGAASEVIVAHRQYTWSELALVLKATGWTACGVFGGFSGEPVSSKSDSLVVVAVAGASKQSPFPS